MEASLFIRIRRQVSAAGFAWAFLMLTACQVQLPPSRTVEIRDAGLSLQLPVDWRVESVNANQLLFARPMQAGKPVPGAFFMLSRDAARADTAATLSSYVQFKEQQAQHLALSYEVEEAAAMTLNGLNLERRLRLIGSRLNQRREYALMWLQGGYGYQLVGAAVPAQFTRLRPQYERAALSLRKSAAQ